MNFYVRLNSLFNLWDFIILSQSDRLCLNQDKDAKFIQSQELNIEIASMFIETVSLIIRIYF
jgi:hypothetical protein